MNLVTDPWLPVTDTKNRLNYISLNQLFKQPDEWGDLVLRPHERVSVMRFLICVVQAALDGPADWEEWDQCLEQIPEASLSYLEKWEGSFNLYDPKKPFLQIADLEAFNKEPTPITKLNFSFATGSNSTLFDHYGINAIKDVAPRLLEESNLIISMLSFNNFSLGGLYPQAKWKNKTTSKSGVKDAPCASQSMFHCLIRRKKMIETLHANILTHEKITELYGVENIGLPIWECFPSSPDDKKAIENATKTHIGRLVPLSRWIKILPDRSTILMGEGFVYPVFPEFREPYAVVTISKYKKDQEYRVLNCKSSSPWRELSAITTKRIGDKKDVGGPAVLDNQSSSESYDLHILALKREQASVLDTMESVLHVPDYYSISDERRASYDDGIKKAEIRANRLSIAIQKYYSFLLPDMVETVQKGLKGEKLKKNESEKYRAMKDRVQNKYLIHYWTLIEKQRHLLMHYISFIGTEQDKEREDAEKSWLNAISHAAKETYQTLCSQESPRQIRAYIAGLNILESLKKA